MSSTCIKSPTRGREHCVWFWYNLTRITSPILYNPSPPRMFLSLDLLLEYRIQHGAIGPLYVTSSYSTWIFCRGVSGFATNCPCDVWCRGLTTCLLHVGPPFGNRFLNTTWAVGLTYWIVYLHFLYATIYVLTHHIIFWLYIYFFIYFIFSNTPVLASSIDVVFVLSMIKIRLSLSYLYWESLYL